MEFGKMYFDPKTSVYSFLSDAPSEWGDLKKSGWVLTSSLEYHQTAICSTKNETEAKRAVESHHLKQQKKVEMYWDSDGVLGGRVGCWRARLAENNGIHDAGATEKSALTNFLRTAKSLNESGENSDYYIVKI